MNKAVAIEETINNKAFVLLALCSVVCQLADISEVLAASIIMLST
jgi:hypothetical protein